MSVTQDSSKEQSLSIKIGELQKELERLNLVVPGSFMYA
jgi:hypothetical protein